ncbi:MAG: Crp/Fnr family transcriptional regulator [Desulfobulbaceae bacterium]|nr:Crp/Fnr family transcriptional regulator [Desulfobulbaceae bacterium]
MQPPPGRDAGTPVEAVPADPLAALFDGVGDEAAARVQREGRRRDWRRYEHLFLAGGPADTVHIVLHGRLRDYYGDGGGNEHLRRIVTPGDIVPFCLLCHRERSHASSCRALCRSTTFDLPLPLFLELAHGHSRFAVNLALAAARQLEHSCRDGCLCRKRQARARVAGYLLSRLGRLPGCVGDGSTVDLRPLSVMAEELGLARETFSRLLMELERQKLVRNARGLVTVLDEAGLLAIATDDAPLPGAPALFSPFFHIP